MDTRKKETEKTSESLAKKFAGSAGKAKRLLILIVAVLSLAIAANAQKTYALLVGVSNYGNCSSNLQNTTKDVKELKKVFDNQGITSSVLTSKYATLQNVKKKLNAIISVAKPDDKIIFYFSGHGNTGFFLLYGLEHFYYKDMLKMLSNSKTKNVVCFIDACMTGSVLDPYYHWEADNRFISFMMSSRAEEFSIENNWVGHGYYTQGLLKGLRGLADANSDNKITLEELFRYVYNDVTARTNTQHPQLIGPKAAFNTVITRW